MKQSGADVMRFNGKIQNLFRRFFRFILIVVIAIITLIFLANFIINNTTRGSTYNSVEAIPYNKAGMIPGTSKYVHGGRPNQYFNNRIKAAADLYKSNKISYIVISGDNSRTSYNEPRDMKRALVSQGIPDSVIYLDYAGFRTYDSVIRMNEIFGQDHFTIISQKFQNDRAIFIAKRFNLNVIGYNATDVNVYYGFKTKLREKLARVKVFIDLATHKKPKFLGEKIEIK